MADLLNRFHISKRTLYYDIKDVNREIKKCGQIQNVAQTFCFYGDYAELQNFLNLNESPNFFNPDIRRDYVLLVLLEGRFKKVERFYEELGISKNTHINDMHNIRQYLKENNFGLKPDPWYTVIGDEIAVRNLYLQLLQKIRPKENGINLNVETFNRQCDLQLTDDALAQLSSFLNFIQYRISMGMVVPVHKPFLKAAAFSFYSALPALIGVSDEAELNYFASYLSSLSSRKSNVENNYVESCLETLLNEFETKTAIEIENREEFKKSIRHHFISLYYRTMFQFPSRTDLNSAQLDLQREPLFKLVKSIIEDCSREFKLFQNMREDEICYITAYFGGYLANSKVGNTRRKRVLLVCPHGLTVSKALQFELAKYIPAVEIVDTIAVNQLKEYKNYYDAIICTIDLPEQEHVIVVNPILTKQDIQKIMNELYGFTSYSYDIDMKSLLHIIEKNTTVINQKRLKSDLMALIYRKTYDERINISMLKDLITERRINVVDHVASWEEGIQVAAQPLVDDHSIETSYITAMIDSVNKYGPYIVLDDYFALPHAKANVGVNRLGMSLLVVKNEVNLLGNPVNIFLVLATVDTTSHLTALGTLSDILCERKNIDVFRAGDKQKILDLINRY